MADEVGKAAATSSAAQAKKHRQNSYYEPMVAVLAIYQLVLAMVLVFIVFMLWPEKDGAGWSKSFQIGARTTQLSDDGRLILIVLCIGALGSYIHAATSFVSYVGNRRLVFSWAWWYILRPFIGMALALIFYFVIRGGLLATSADPSEINPFGIAAVAGLVGMFSKQATDKLRELFDNLFKTDRGHGDDARSDKLATNRPVASEMIDRSKMTAYVVPEGKTDQQVRMIDLHRLLGGFVSRIPVLDHEGVAKCVIHESLLYKYLADQSIAAAGTSSPFNAESHSLDQFLNTAGMKEFVQDSMAFVPVGAMLSEAKDRMEKTKYCRDVFVTEHGLPNEPVLGWLTDGELLRPSKA